jgi:arylsulfatase A-like enzyme
VNRRVFLQAGTAALAQPAPPNLIVVVADPKQVAVRGGTHFQRAYAADPESEPAQACILTGLYPHTCGVVRRGDRLPSDKWCMAAAFRAAGYHTCHVGEWRLGGHPKAFGFVDAASRFSAELVRSGPSYLHVDAAEDWLGPILNAAERSNTLLVLTAVHGEAGPGSPREGSVRVPLWIRWTGRELAGQEVDVLFSHVDLAPTILGLCEMKVSVGFQGRDLSRSVLRSESVPSESVLAYGRIGTKDEWVMIVRGLDKLVVNSAMETTHLYNLGLDPKEETNLAEPPSHELTRDELKAHLREWMRRIGYRMDPSGLKIRP